MNKKTYESPEMTRRLVAMSSIATESAGADDNVIDGGEGGEIDWS